jgi:hypothetical protein
MRQRVSWLRIVLLLALTAAIGCLAGYGVLRLWRDHVEAAAAELAAKQAAAAPATPTPVVASPPSQPAPTPTNRNASVNRVAPARPSGPVPTASPLLPPMQSSLEPEPAATTPETAGVVDDSADPPPATPPTPPRPSYDPTLQPQFSVVMDLSRSRQQQAIDADGKDLKIVGLSGCDAKYELKPDSIVIQGPREIVIAVEITRLGSGKTQVSLEPTVKNDAGKDMPFTVRNMENVRRQIGQTGEQATNQIAAWRQEQANAEAYISSTTIRKTPAQESAARARVAELKRIVPPAEQQLVAMKTDFDTAEKMVELATALSDKCVVLLEEKR